MKTQREKDIALYSKMAITARNMNRMDTAEYYDQRVRNLTLKPSNKRGKV